MVVEVSEDFLNRVGLNHFHYNVILITLLSSLFLILIVYICNRYAVFKSIEFEYEKLQQAQIIYINHMGAYQNLEYKFNAVKSVLNT